MANEYRDILRTFEVDRLLKIFKMESLKRYGGEFTITARADGYVAAFGRPLNKGEEAQFTPSNSLKHALIAAIEKNHLYPETQTYGLKDVSTKVLTDCGVPEWVAEEIKATFLGYMSSVGAGIKSEKLQESFDYIAPRLFLLKSMPCKICGCEKADPVVWKLDKQMSEKVGAKNGQLRMVFLSMCQDCFSSEETDKKLHAILLKESKSIDTFNAGARE